MTSNRSHFNPKIKMDENNNLINLNINNNNKKPIKNKPKHCSLNKASSFLNNFFIVFLAIYLSKGFLSFQVSSY